MKWNSLLRADGRLDNKCLGGYAEAFDPAFSLQFVETDERFRRAWPYSIVGIFGKGWDNLKTLDDEVVRLARKESNASREVIVSNEEDFFRDFEKTYGARLPEHAAAFGNEWELYAASVAEISARVRRSVEKLRTAEALATLVSLRRPGFLKGREEARDLAFLNLGLYWEHNWTGDGPIQRGARARWGRRLAGEIEGYVDRLEADAAWALGDMTGKRGAKARFYVFNPLGWARTDVADIPYDGPLPVHVVEAESGAETPSQLVTLEGRTYTKGRAHLRILAKDVPAVGYRVYEIRRGAGAKLGEAATVSDGVMESALYRLRVAGRGAITSLVDRGQGGREFARSIEGLAINDIGVAEGTLAVENAGAVSVTLRAEVKAPLERTTRVTLYRDVNRIEIGNEITQNFSGVEAWRFGFNLEAPEVWHEEVGAIIRARLTGEGGHYSPVHSRLDWLTLNHFAAMSGAGGAGVTLSNADLAFMRLGASAVVDGVSRLDTASPQISVLAGGQVDGPRLGVPAQGGDSYFLQRFALRTYGKYQAAEAMRFALEHQNPLRAALVTGGEEYPEAVFSLVTVKDPGTLLWALKPAEEGVGQGVIARVWNVEAEGRELSLSVRGGIAGAKRASHIETDLGEVRTESGAVSLPMKGRQVVTLRLRVRPGQ
jgi:alpha-mannosidase